MQSWVVFLSSFFVLNCSIFIIFMRRQFFSFLLYHIQVDLIYSFFNSFHSKNRVFPESMMIKRWVQYLLWNQFSHHFHLYLFEHMYILCIKQFLCIFYLFFIRKTVPHHSPTFLINPCSHFLFT